MYSVLEKFIRSKGEISSEKIEIITSCFQPVNTKRNEILLQYDEVCKWYYFINKGCIRLFTTTKDGTDSSRYFAFEGNFATALPSFIDQKPAQEYLQTIEKSELLRISRKDFYLLVENVPEFAKIYTEILELGFIIAQKRIYGFQGFDALERVKWLIEYQPQLLLRVSNRMVASYLGISPSTLSRIKSKL
ncbi:MULTISPECIES: Crp/Fnr family transcriptional regulator [Chryseobacterium]|uniref:cAMP-binding domain of CRP or a regulatory subunit of cAMP-dependent protein kinases n=1 Tax=Chryseobacterium gambrini TaxID=373672 RepID=A0A1N7QRX2_9FLAO|nr:MULTISPECIES: Crp/Fnr family transcriptional regulator [Chryseobacterium]SIT25509.1 cAMP-binding domain of CRP or a regulatory subunit of cAMP-dependent protein kinases [Chryseobacterium gambrini]